MRMLAMLWAAALLAADAPTPAAAQVARPAAVVKPKIVVQAMSEGGFDVAAWSTNSRFIFTASGLLHELLVWDSAAGVIVDRLHLPANPTSMTEFMRLEQMVLQPDGRTLRLDGTVLDETSADLRGSRAYEVDILSRQVRTVTPRPLRPLAAGKDWTSEMTRWTQALGVVHSEMSDMTKAEALRILPALPASPDGRWQMLRSGLAFELRDASGKRHPMRAASQLLGGIDDADLSPDDKRLAFLTLDEKDTPVGETASKVQLFDITVGRFLTPVPLTGDYNLVRWINNNQFYVLPQDDSDDPLNGAAEGAPAPAVLVDAAAGSLIGRYPARCFMATMPDGGLVGAGLANCRNNAGKDNSLVRLVGGVWQPLPGIAMPADGHIRLIAASPRGDRGC